MCLQRGEVEYSLRAIPLGGYVAFPDDDPKNTKYQPDDPDLLQNRSIPERGLVISAGVIANIVFALAVLFAQVGVQQPNTQFNRIVRTGTSCSLVLAAASADHQISNGSLCILGTT